MLVSFVTFTFGSIIKQLSFVRDLLLKNNRPIYVQVHAIKKGGQMGLDAYNKMLLVINTWNGIKEEKWIVNSDLDLHMIGLNYSKF